MAYQPYGRTKIILDRAMGHIQSVPYQVSVRWVFYRLLQEGLYRDKKDYKNLVQLTARARKDWYKDWNPQTLADDTREMVVIKNNGEPPDPDIDQLIEQEMYAANEKIEWYREEAENYQHTVSYEIDPNYYQRPFLPDYVRGASYAPTISNLY